MQQMNGTGNTCGSDQVYVDALTGEVFTEAERLLDEKNGKVVEWRTRKLLAEEMSTVYERLGASVGERYAKKAYRISQCGCVLIYKYYPETGKKKLHQARFCKVRLCPMCAWRRSLKIYGQVSRVMDYVTENFEYDYIFLTLTIENMSADGFKSALDKLLKAFDRLTKRKEFMKVSYGHFRALEVTHDKHSTISKEMYRKKKSYYDRRGLKVGDDNPNFNKYHPHFHVIIAVDKRYCKEPSLYIPQAQWTQLWQDCLGVNYTPIVDVRRVKPDQEVGEDEPFSVQYAKAVSEVAKYTVKSDDMIFRLGKDTKDKVGKKAYEHFKKELEKLTDEVVMTLDGGLRYRRLVAFGGRMKEVHKQLELDCAIDGDLVNTDNGDEIRNDLKYVLLEYHWVVGLSDYFKVAEYNE